jgi:hypothetical protein
MPQSQPTSEVLRESQRERALVFAASIHAMHCAARDGHHGIAGDIERNLYKVLCEAVRLETLTAVLNLEELVNKQFPTLDTFKTYIASYALTHEEETMRSHEILRNLIQHVKETCTSCQNATKRSETR